jgi:hypothetical protein
MALITDFLPYFYIALPKGMQDDELSAFKGYLNVGRQVRFQSCLLMQRSESSAVILFWKWRRSSSGRFGATKETIGCPSSNWQSVIRRAYRKSEMSIWSSPVWPFALIPWLFTSLWTCRMPIPNFLPVRACPHLWKQYCLLTKVHDWYQGTYFIITSLQILIISGCRNELDRGAAWTVPVSIRPA